MTSKVITDNLLIIKLKEKESTVTVIILDMLGNGTITCLKEKGATNFPKISGMTEVGSKEKRVAMAN